MMNFDHYLQQIKLPAPDSHKGQNGKLLIIGGSELFHAASKWSLDIASKFVDMVFYSSVPVNNELILEAKSNFWNGIVVPREEVESYLQEADCVLIGPGMERTQETAEIVNDLLAKYGHKKWVIDAGALQMVDPELLSESCIITPHYQELMMISEHKYKKNRDDGVYDFGDFITGISDPEDALNQVNLACVRGISGSLGGSVVLIKGVLDYVGSEKESLVISGGNPGMTKGGTGDVLAGLVAALYCSHQAEVAAVVGSWVNKKAGESLWQKVGPYFNASDLVNEIPQVMWSLYQQRSSDS